MKRLIIILTIAVAASGVSNAQKIRVTLNKLYSDTSDFMLPSRAIETKMPCLTIANEKYDFTRKLKDIARKIANDDEENNVFTVMLKYSGVGISIVIDSQDVLDLEDTKFHGDLIVDRRHFVLLENDDNKDLLKTYFKKAKGKDVVMERTFEKVVDLIIPEPTHYNAIYNERQQTVKVNEKIINGRDTMHVPLPINQEKGQEQETDDNDAFKIDVELFDE